MRQIGPGMIQQMQSVCADCNGRGESIKEEDKCTECKGKKVIRDKKILHVYVDKGMKDGDKIFFRGDADEQVRKKKIIIKNYLTLRTLEYSALY